MRVVLFMLLLFGVPLQAAVPLAAASHAAACCDGGSSESPEPCCPDGTACECGCPATVVQPPRVEEQGGARVFPPESRNRIVGQAAAGDHWKARPPSPPPRELPVIA